MAASATLDATARPSSAPLSSAPETSQPSGAPEPCARLPKPPLLPDELHLWLLDAHRRGNLARYDFVKGLLLMHDNELAPALGSPGVRQYAKKYFQLSDSAVDEALLLARRIDGLPHTLMSFRDGNICWSAAYQICRVATAYTEEQWLDFAKERSVRQIAEEVTAAIAEGRQKPRKDAWGLPELRQKMTFDFSPLEYELVAKALEKLAFELDDALAREARKQKGGDGADGSRTDGMEEEPRGVPPSEERHERLRRDPSRTMVLFSKKVLETDRFLDQRKKCECSPYHVIACQCPTCLVAHVDTKDGPRQISRRELLCLAPDADRVELGCGKSAGNPREACSPSLGEALARNELLEWLNETGDKDTPCEEALRRKIRLRDGGRCANPHCRCRLGLQVHHVVFRSKGGKTVAWNLISVCPRCHATIHAGTLTVTFTPSGQLVWRQRADSIRLPSGEEGLPPGSVLVADEEGGIVGDLDGSPGREEIEGEIATEIAFEVEEVREGETEPKAGSTGRGADGSREGDREREAERDEPATGEAATDQPPPPEVATDASVTTEVGVAEASNTEPTPAEPGADGRSSVEEAVRERSPAPRPDVPTPSAATAATAPTVGDAGTAATRSPTADRAAVPATVPGVSRTRPALPAAASPPPKTLPAPRPPLYLTWLSPGKHASRNLEEMNLRLDGLFASLFDFLPKPEVIDITLGVEEELRTSGRWWKGLLEDRHSVPIPRDTHPLLGGVYESLVCLGYTEGEATVRVGWLEEGLVEKGRIPPRAIIPTLIAAGWNPRFPESPVRRSDPRRLGSASPGAEVASAAPAAAIEGAGERNRSMAPAARGVLEVAMSEAADRGEVDDCETEASESYPAEPDLGPSTDREPDPGPAADPEPGAEVSEFERWLTGLCEPGPRKESD